MEHYPDIQRRDGTLFFVLPETTPRAAIATSIERLIDMLDAMEGDPDFEPYLAGFDHDTSEREDDAGDCREADYADDEPSLAAAERHPTPSGFMYGDHAERHTQERWACGAEDEREDDGDDLEPDNDAEYSNGWTGHIDQTKAVLGNCNMDGGEGEPDLGFVGISTGWREGEDKQDREADQLGCDEREKDHAEHGVCDYDVDTCSALTAEQAGLVFDGAGVEKAKMLLATAKPRREPYSELIGTRRHFLKDGSIFTTLVAR